jgi:dTDP-4-amino-4,6-dideoxygalactose transaminase
MNVPFVGYKIQYENLKKEIDDAVQSVLSRGDLILREDSDEFEKKLAEFTGAKYAIGLNSGTDALFLSLLAAGIREGDEVITVSHTFVASIAAIVQVGATPVLIDVSDDFVMDADKLEEAINEKTKAIIPVYLNGRMCDMDRVMEIADKHNLIVIEDSAQALGASFNGRKAGSIGLTGCFSFYPAKILGCFGDGGGLTTNDEKIIERIRLLRDHGQKTKTEILCYGWNSRLDNLQAAVLNVKLKYLPQWIERRREIAQMYQDGLSDVSGIKLPPAPNSDSKHFDVFQNYVLRAEKRDELFNFLKDNNIETLIKDPVATHQQEGLDLSHFKLPVSERLAKEVISLPMYPELTDEQIQYIISTVRKFYSN